MTTTPTPPIAFASGTGPITSRLGGPLRSMSEATLGRLRGVCQIVDTDEGSRAESGRDWWPLALRWALRGQ
ncbi:MAG: hypothetical protein ACRD0E_12370, partial [Acidimicrobiales bacterium]